MTDLDGRLHAQVIASFIERGHAPGTSELAASLAVERAELDASLRRLHAGHGLVLHPDSLAIWIAHPFSTSPTTACVTAGDRTWWAPCMWCAAGILALAGAHRWPIAAAAAAVALVAALLRPQLRTTRDVRGGRRRTERDYLAALGERRWRERLEYRDQLIELGGRKYSVEPRHRGSGDAEPDRRAQVVVAGRFADRGRAPLVRAGREISWFPRRKWCGRAAPVAGAAMT